MKNRKLSKWLWSILPVAVFLLIWELAARLDLMPGNFYFPPFSAVAVQFYRLTASGVLVDDFLSSFRRILIGSISGSVAGILTGVLMGWRDTVHRSLSPLVSLIYPIPALGWLPLLMLWIGINEMLPIAIIFISTFFPVLYTTVTGIRNVDAGFVRVARTLGATDYRILAGVVIPLALPNIFTGLKLQAGHAWRVIIAAEMVAIPTGIGALMMKAESLLRMDIIIVCLIVLSIMCLASEKLFEWLERKMTAEWK